MGGKNLLNPVSSAGASDNLRIEVRSLSIPVVFDFTTHLLSRLKKLKYIFVGLFIFFRFSSDGFATPKFCHRRQSPTLPTA